MRPHHVKKDKSKVAQLRSKALGVRALAIQDRTMRSSAEYCYAFKDSWDLVRKVGRCVGRKCRQWPKLHYDSKLECKSGKKTRPAWSGAFMTGTMGDYINHGHGR